MGKNIFIVKEQNIFNQAIEYLNKKKLDFFVQKIYELNAVLTCDCFYQFQDKEIFSSMINIIDEFYDDESDFIINFSKGYIYLLHSRYYYRNYNSIKAYTYLKNAHKLNLDDDFVICLLAIYIDDYRSENHSESIGYIEKAVELNPSARNYFLLANTFLERDRYFERANFESAIRNFKKAIELNGQFACAYSSLGILFEAEGEFDFAIKEYESCLRVQSNHWAYRMLWYCLNLKGEYTAALRVAQQGLEIHVNDLNYLLRLSTTYFNMNDYKMAIYWFEKYIFSNMHKPYFEKYFLPAMKNLPSHYTSHNNINYHYHSLILPHHDSFKEYKSIADVLSKENFSNYLYSLLKFSNPLIQINESNPIYLRLVSLENTMLNKNMENLSEEECNVKKLIVYYPYQKLGFGKYKGVSLFNIEKKDPHYILWCIINLDHFSVCNNILISQHLKNQPEYLLAVEYNLIKLLFKPEMQDNENFI